MKGKKTGGRVKGTPNIMTKSTKDCLQHVVDWYTSPNAEKMDESLLFQDLKAMDPDKRFWAMEKMMQYVVPKLQAIQVSPGGEKKLTIDVKLRELAKDPE